MASAARAARTPSAAVPPEGFCSWISAWTYAGFARQRRQELEEQVATRTRDLQYAIESLAAADAEKRQLVIRIDAMLEKERQRIALEIRECFERIGDAGSL